MTKELIISKISKEYQIDEKILKQNIDIKQIKQKEDKKEERKPKISKYQKAVSKILYMMMLDNKYITIYKNRLGYFKEKKEREVASEIIYYNSKNDINIADFLTYILNNEELSEFIDNILGENENTKDSIEEFNNCIEVVLKILKEDEIEKLKVEIKNELDINKKVELMTRLTEIKKEV